MPTKPIPLTPEGLARIEAELDYLRTVRRREVAEQIHRAKELANAANNAEYDDAKNEQAFVEGRILSLEYIIQNAVVIHRENIKTDRIQLGSLVTVRNADGQEEHYTIVGSPEANPRKGLISNESPVGQALLNKRVGDELVVEAPAGKIRYTVVNIS